MSIQALRERLAASNKSANALLADKGAQTWSKEDQGKFDAHMDESERIQAQIEAHDRAAKLDVENSFADYKDFKKTDLTDKEKQAKVGFEAFLRKNIKDMTQEELLAVKNTMSTTTTSQGGYTVQSNIASQMIDYLKAYGWMRKVSSQITTDNGQPLNFPTSDGRSEVGEIVSQNTSASSLDPSYGTVPLNVFKFSSKIITVPIELLQDSVIDVQAMVFKRIRDRIGRITNQQFTLGDGTTGPQGLVPAASVGKVGLTGQTLTIIYDDLVDLIDSLDAAYLDDPVTDQEMPGIAPGWMFSQTMRKVLRKLKDTTGRPLWTPSYDAGIGPKFTTQDSLMGYPVYLNNDFAVPAANAKSLGFGNLHRYLIRDAMEMTMFRFDDSVYMSKGQVGFLAWARMGGNLMDINSFSMYQNSAT